LQLTRRSFIKGAASSLFLAGFPAYGLDENKRLGNIVVILLEGGMDGLLAIPPIGDKNLLDQRAELVPKNLINLDDFFYAHPNLKDFSSLYRSNEAALVHATAMPYVKRSHFEGQNIMESGNLIPFADKTGWLGRALDEAKIPGRALALNMPLILRGHRDVDNYYPAKLKGSSQAHSLTANILASAHQGLSKDSFKKLEKKYQIFSPDRPRNVEELAKYAGQEIAKPFGPKAAVLRVGRFDTHAKQGSNEGQHSEQILKVNNVFESLKRNLGNAWQDTIIVTLTEFGRTVSANGSEGTDHGYGSVGLLAGGLINSAYVYSDWPGLKQKNLYEERDLYATTDYRSVLAYAIEAAYKIPHDRVTEKIFYDSSIPSIAKHFNQQISKVI
tara:strand:+ start:15873 stop:17030 length:1158 start_codon:yes stop_codon:yes gene_type:complete